jgi:hypothetical protein
MLSTKFAVSGRAGFPERRGCWGGGLPVGRQQDAEVVLVGPCGLLTHRPPDAKAPAAPEQDLPFPGVEEPLNPKPRWSVPPIFRTHAPPDWRYPAGRARHLVPMSHPSAAHPPLAANQGHRAARRQGIAPFQTARTIQKPRNFNNLGRV